MIQIKKKKDYNTLKTSIVAYNYKANTNILKLAIKQ